MLKLFLHELRIRRMAIIGLGIGLAIFAGYIIVLYPQFAEPMEQFNLEEITLYQVLGDFGDMASFKGFVTAEVFTFLPLLLAIYAMVNATGTLAGEEDEGTLEPLLALPLHRWQVVLAKALALAFALILVLLIVVLAMVLAMNTLGEDVNTGGINSADLTLAAFGVWPLLLFFAMLSLFLGAFMPSRRHALITATIILVVSYFGNNLAGLVSWLEDIQFLFAFKYYDPQFILTDGLAVKNTLILFGISLGFLLLALISFQRRNVTVGAWPWQRGRLPGKVEKQLATEN